MNFPQVYLAGPFFKPEQIDVCRLVEEACDVSGVEYISPRKICVVKKDSPSQLLQKAFNDNCKALAACDLVLANIEGYDTGTIWEMGYAYAIGKNVVAYSFLPGRVMNLMLARSCAGFASTIQQIQQFIAPLKDQYGNHRYNWTAIQTWDREVE